MIVADASAVVAMLVDGGESGHLARAEYAVHEFAHPSLMPYEAANTLRRLANNGAVAAELAGRSIVRLTQLRGQSFDFEQLHARVWQLRHTVTAYDAAYVALAEVLDVPLLTFDRWLTAAPGVRCQFVDITPQPPAPPSGR